MSERTRIEVRNVGTQTHLSAFAKGLGAPSTSNPDNLTSGLFYCPREANKWF